MKIKKNFFFLHYILKKLNFKFDKKKIKNVKIINIGDILNSKKNYITFFSNINYLSDLNRTKASVIFVKQDHLKYLKKKIIPIISKNPEIDFIKVSKIFYPDSYFSKISYDYLSTFEIKRKFKDLKFGLNFYLEKKTKIGKNVFIGNNVTIKDETIIGNNVIIGSNVSIERSIISDNTHICDGSIIGKKGFGFKFINNDLCLRVPHIGKVLIGNNCEIGANCVIDRGSVKNTIIGKNTFLDNFVHIAHNVKIGNNCILAAQVGIAGSSIIGNNVNIGGQSGISGHLIIGDNVKIGGKSGVVKNIKDNEIVMGYPAKPIKDFLKK